MKQSGMEYNQRRFNSEWLWVNQSDANLRVCFRACAALSDTKKTITAYIAAETRFRLWVNGRIVVYDGGTHRESLPGSGYYHTLELAPYLQKGDNLIAVEVWYWGNGGRNNKNSGAGGMLFECPSLQLKTGDWKAAINPAWKEVNPPVTSHLYGGHDTGWDARNELGSWMMPGYEDSAFGPVLAKGVYPAEPWGVLYESPIPLMQFSDIKPYTEWKEEPGLVRAILPYAAHLTPWMKIDAQAGKTVLIHTDRWEVHGGPGDEQHTYRGHKVEYITRDGIQEFEPFDWFFGEEVLYFLPEGVRLLEAGWRESGYPTQKAGVFKSADVQLDKLVQKSARTLSVCMRENYMDCPDRERGQWIGDVSGQVPQTFYALDRSSDSLTRKAISDFIRLRRGDQLVGNVPGQHSGELPSQSLNAVSDLGMVMTYSWFSGDLSVLDFAYPAVKNYLSLWEITGKNELVPRKGDWQWYDHKNCIDGDVLEYGWYLLALMGAKRMAQQCAPDDVAEFDIKISALQYTADQLFWDGRGYRSRGFAEKEGEGIYDDRAQALAILSGIACGKKTDAAADLLKTMNYSTPYMEYYVLKALFLAGREQQATARMMKRYGPLISNENSTLWEDFMVLGTRNHAWSGGPLTIAYQHLAGISPLSPGFKKVLFVPSPAAPDRMDATVPSPSGYVRLNLDKSAERFRMTIQLPSECEGVAAISRSMLPQGYRLVTNEGVQPVQNFFCPDLPLCAKPVLPADAVFLNVIPGRSTIEAVID